MKVLIAFLMVGFTLTVAADALARDSSRRASAAPPSTTAPTPTRTATPVPTRRPFFATTPTPTATATPVPRIAPAEGPGLMTMECGARDANGVRVYFLWTPSGAGQQWLDLSTINDGFAPGTFVSKGPFSSHGWGTIWDGVAQGTTHYARVNTMTERGWMASGTLTFYTPVCDPEAFSPPPAADMLQLRDRLADAIASSGIDAAVAITDLQTGETIDVHGSENRLPGCTVNLFVLLQVVIDLQAGAYPEPEAGDLIYQTIHRSDAQVSRNLLKYWLGRGDVQAGLRRVNKLYGDLGMTHTLMDHPPAFWNESLNGGIDNRMTALDANIGLRAIWDGRVLVPGWRDYFLRKMAQVKPGLNYLIPAGIGYGATASHKNGFLWEHGWADNDIGIVWFQRDGRRYAYAISFFTEGVAVKYADIPMGQRVSSLAWQWFAGRYGRP